MRARLVLLAISSIALLNLFGVANALPMAAPDDAVTLAQTPEQPEEQDVGGEESEGEGASDPEAETGAGGEGEEAAPEEGPLWTWQMARISLLGVLPLIAAIGYWYWRFVGSRTRES